MGSLTATAVKAASEPGRYGDGDGLFLLIGKRGGKSWIVRVQKDGRRRDIGLGSAKKVSLKLARERAAEVRSQIEVGIDPVAERQKAAGIPTFSEAARLVHAENAPSWKNPKHARQWITTLEAYAFPAFGNRSVASVDAAAVRDALVAIWLEKPETARRLRQRINTVIDWAVAKGYRDSGLALPVIDKALPKQRAQPKHHKALPYSELPEFMGKLREGESMGRLALEAVILTAARSGEVRLAEWSEIDLDAATWAIPAERMKAGREHVVPLSPEAVALFERVKAHRRGDSDLVFPGQRRGKPLSDMTLTKVMRDMGRDEVPHGFRSTFRDWVAEQTHWPAELAEAALAHVVGDKTVAAYQRGSMLEKRRELMAAWAAYCEGASGGNVVRLAT
ncbi:integrase arm-type DNA-binding domain-containing protein [Alteriqipengyuania sp. NZ-12B]|uniref:Integrase arm-type DNA-binding domain-containing protein n=1 Tax=Alteriqipengyuania abyssalis TaxID=2860200 RepID=A0ABS7PG39_9SPHN|nr:site-specific integrase [Alteriqipengyuania abyssalis]MBY8337931.1 integrase arm-type DNA-binding domain-containing protein [Alteriqipengyuania abyssalis]